MIDLMIWLGSDLQIYNSIMAAPNNCLVVSNIDGNLMVSHYIRTK
jgi:hypothetical protein